MNILLIVFAVILVWRVAAGVKRGVVRETLGFINIIFAALVIGLVCIGVNAYHAEGYPNYLTILSVIVIIAVLSIVYSIIKLVFFPAKVITKLPIISSADKLFGLVIGVVETLIVYWALCCVVMYVDFGVLNEQITAMIGESRILTKLYQYNLLGVLMETVKTKLTF